MNKETIQTCAVAKTAELLSDPWTMLIIRDLIRNDLRFCELERALDGISTRTLTIKLKTLEEQGIIQKKDHGYVITKTGKKLQGIIDAMEDFGKKL